MDGYHDNSTQNIIFHSINENLNQHYQVKLRRYPTDILHYANVQHAPSQQGFQYLLDICGQYIRS